MLVGIKAIKGMLKVLEKMGKGSTWPKRIKKERGVTLSAWQNQG